MSTHHTPPNKPDQNAITLSKKLSRLLRHRATQAGLHVDNAGYIPINQILTHKHFHNYTIADIQQAVHTNDKQRFSFKQSAGNLYIRANQGHSGAVAHQIDPNQLLHRLQLSDLTDETVCIHGTNWHAWKQIEKTGLSRMGRQMIHFAIGLPGQEGVISGMRTSASILIYVDVGKALADGIPFFKSENNVLLSPGSGESGVLPVEYFKRVERRSTGERLFPAVDVGAS